MFCSGVTKLGELPKLRRADCAALSSPKPFQKARESFGPRWNLCPSPMKTRKKEEGKKTEGKKERRKREKSTGDKKR